MPSPYFIRKKKFCILQIESDLFGEQEFNDFDGEYYRKVNSSSCFYRNRGSYSVGGGGFRFMEHPVSLTPWAGSLDCLRMDEFYFFVFVYWNIKNIHTGRG